MVIDRELTLLLTGAVIALASSVIAALVQHALSLRTDRIKRERDNKERESERRRETLLAGADEILTRRAAGVYFGEGADFVGAKIRDVAGRDIRREEEEEEGDQEEKPDEPTGMVDFGEPAA